MKQQQKEKKFAQVTINFEPSILKHSILDVFSSNTTGLRRALRSRVSKEAQFSAYFEETRVNDSFKYATLPRNFHRSPPKPGHSSAQPSRDNFSPNNSLDTDGVLDTNNDHSKAIANLRAMNTMTLGRINLTPNLNSRINGPGTPTTDRNSGAFAKFYNFRSGKSVQIPPNLNQPIQNYPDAPLAPKNTPTKTSTGGSHNSSNGTLSSGGYRPASAAAGSPFLNKRLSSKRFNFNAYSESEDDLL